MEAYGRNMLMRVALVAAAVLAGGAADRAHAGTGPAPIVSAVNETGETGADPGEAAMRVQELDELSARLRRAEERRRAGQSGPAVPDRRGDPIDQSDAAEGRVAVLLVMKPGSRGIRRFVKSADPVLCLFRTCYVSRGSGAQASAISRVRALGAANTFGERAGACRDRVTCIYRGVQLEPGGALVQPVDLRIVHHDQREVRLVTADASCRMGDRGLACNHPVEAVDYVMWIVPERLAGQIGPRALEAAVGAGLRSAAFVAAKAR